MEILLDHKPTIIEMDSLQSPNYYNFNGTLYIHSYLEGEISARTHKVMYQSVFECPWCYTKYNKDGQPSKTAKRTVHRHGATLGFDHKGSHCQDHHPGDYYICTTRDINGNLINETDSYTYDYYQPNYKSMWINRNK